MFYEQYTFYDFNPYFEISCIPSINLICFYCLLNISLISQSHFSFILFSKFYIVHVSKWHWIRTILWVYYQSFFCMMTGQIYKRDMDQALGLLEQKKRLSNPHIKLPQSYLKQNVTLPLNQHLPPPSLKFSRRGRTSANIWKCCYA